MRQESRKKNNENTGINQKGKKKNNRNRSDMICQNSKAGNFNAKISAIAYKQTTYTDQFTTY